MSGYAQLEFNFRSLSVGIDERLSIDAVMLAISMSYRTSKIYVLLLSLPLSPSPHTRMRSSCLSSNSFIIAANPLCSALAQNEVVGNSVAHLPLATWQLGSQPSAEAATV